MPSSPASERRAIGVVFAIGLAALSTLCVSNRALAEPSPGASEKETARGLVALGNTKFASDDFEGALEAYSKADAIMHVPTTGLGVGRSLARLGRLTEARDLLLRVSGSAATTRESEAFRQARVEATDLVEQITSRLSTLRLSARCSGTTTGVEITVDGTRVAPSAETTSLRVDPGRHQVVAEAPGCIRTERDVQAAEGRVVDLDWTLPADGPKTESASRALATSATRAAHLGSPSLPLLISGSIGAGIGIAVGTATGVASLSLTQKVKDQCAGNVCPTSMAADGHRAMTLAHVSTASFVFAGVGVATAITGGVLLGRHSTSNVALTIGPAQLGVAGDF